MPGQTSRWHSRFTQGPPPPPTRPQTPGVPPPPQVSPAGQRAAVERAAAAVADGAAVLPAARWQSQVSGVQVPGVGAQTLGAGRAPQVWPVGQSPQVERAAAAVADGAAVAAAGWRCR